ncbi:MAG: formimidoylglutamate deiminase [Paracoccaceae bacterium]
MHVFAERALVGDAWLRRVRLTLGEGEIRAIETGAAAGPDDVRVDALLPALSNLHSHAFQRAMAGMTEARALGRDGFWSWRTLMYRFLDRLTPEHVEAIAALAQMEMLEAGFAAVGEFHYLHHAPDGRPYDRPSELSERIFAAAATTGIGLTHLPVLYRYAGLGREPLEGGQRRFGNDHDRFLALVADCERAVAALAPDTVVGVAPHSLRAVAPDDLERLVAARPDGPVHLHIAEQTREVEAVEAALGARPVAWLLANAPVDGRWCLVHATHTTGDETTVMARSGAVAGLCPITEANLGDGVFDGARYAAQGGAFGVGSDSNVRIALGEELRTLEYGQRLRDRARNVMPPAEGSTGAWLYREAARGGARALGRRSGEIAVGRLADLVAIDGGHPALSARDGDRLLDGLCFAAGDGVVGDTWSAGRHVVRGGRHVRRDAILAAYRGAIASLRDAL